MSISKHIMDNLNKQLVGLLQQDGRQSSQVIAKQLHVSSATIRRRLSNLLENGSIRIVAAIDPAKVGYSLRSLVINTMLPV